MQNNFWSEQQQIVGHSDLPTEVYLIPVSELGQDLLKCSELPAQNVELHLQPISMTLFSCEVYQWELCGGPHCSRVSGLNRTLQTPYVPVLYKSSTFPFSLVSSVRSVGSTHSAWQQSQSQPLSLVFIPGAWCTKRAQISLWKNRGYSKIQKLS